MTRFTSDDFSEGYWERGEGSNYSNYADDGGWEIILDSMSGWVTGNKLLEVACAKGWFVQHALQRGYEAKGFDISEYAISSAPQPAASNIYVADAIEPFDGSDFDVVVAWEFLEHIPEEHIDTVLGNISASLRPGGQVWLKICIFREDTDHDDTHVSIFPREWWEDKMRNLGFEHIPDAEGFLDEKFIDRDWAGRFFVWRKPVGGPDGEES